MGKRYGQHSTLAITATSLDIYIHMPWQDVTINHLLENVHCSQGSSDASLKLSRMIVTSEPSCSCVRFGVAAAQLPQPQ